MDLTAKAIQDAIKTIERFENRQDFVFYMNESTWKSLSLERQEEIKNFIIRYYGRLSILKGNSLEDGKIYYLPVNEDWYMDGVKKVPPKVVKKQWNPNRRRR